MKEAWYWGGALTLGLTWLLAAGCGNSESTGVFNPATAQVIPTPPPVSQDYQDPVVALANLKAGNARYVQGTNTVLYRSADRPLVLNSSQAPEAMILCCSDSRVAPELAFDQAWGQLFVVRVAGPVADTIGLGSLEFANAVLKSRLLVVLGHEQCGACAGAIANNIPPGNLNDLVQLIVPAAKAVQGQPGDPLENTIKANIALQMQRIRNLSKPLDDAVKSGNVVIKGALYHFNTGEIEYLPI